MCIIVGVLPDDVLLGIFDFLLDMSLSCYQGKKGVGAWQLLIHVCRRWRSLVLASPRRLNLQLYCAPETPITDTLDVWRFWPTLPLVVSGDITSSSINNVIATLGLSNRVCQVKLHFWVQSWQSERVLAAMQGSFPELTVVQFWRHDSRPVIPDSFLAGSAPRLQVFTLDGILFPGFPKQLCSAKRLIHLRAAYVSLSYSFYNVISPEMMIALLSELSSLKTLCLKSQALEYLPDWEGRSLRSPKHSTLPSLDEFHFAGLTKYLEDLVTSIDTPSTR